MSSSYLSTKFKKKVGISFTEYLVTFRINKACEILLNKSIPIKTVANMVAYDDYSQFSKIFKKYTGKTPKEYREQF
nr:AraC family transcriptional regulator [Clostridium novyi]